MTEQLEAGARFAPLRSAPLGPFLTCDFASSAVSYGIEWMRNLRWDTLSMSIPRVVACNGCELKTTEVVKFINRVKSFVPSKAN